MKKNNNEAAIFEEICKGISEFATRIPQITEDDIYLVKMNPRLSLLDKWYIVRKMRKQMKYSDAIAECELNIHKGQDIDGDKESHFWWKD